MKYLLAGLVLTTAVCAGEPISNMRVTHGASVGTLEDVAVHYFDEVAYLERNVGMPNVELSAREVLRDRDGLTEAQASEIIAVALQLDTPQAKALRVGKEKGLQKKTCADLLDAKTADEAVAVIEGQEAQLDAAARLQGAQLLAQLTPATRAKLRKVLVAFREGLTEHRRDWQKATPKQLERYKQRNCAVPT